MCLGLTVSCKAYGPPRQRMTEPTCLGYTFAQPALLGQALTHRSTGVPAHNERLEFLGDRVLNLAIAELLWRQFPDATEGSLAPWHAQLVSAETLAERAQAAGLGPRLQLGKGELRQGGASKLNILADALEAVLGAIYLDGGWPAAQAAIATHWQALLPNALNSATSNPKSALQEWLQARGLPLPQYTITHQAGPAHARQFTVCATTNQGQQAVGTGPSRQAAEQQAAAQLLQILLGTHA